MGTVGLLRKFLVVAAGLDFAIGLYPGADKIRQRYRMFPRCDAAVGKACGFRVHTSALRELVTQPLTGLEQGRAGAACAPRPARTRGLREIGIAEFDPDALGR